jgi:uncharacterized protein YcbK (DUF882 family)
MKLTKENFEEFAKKYRITNFKFEEFCPEGGYIESDLVLKLQMLREFVLFPLVITSGFRTPEKNLQVGGAKNSFHLVGKAVDISIEGLPPSKVYFLLKGAFIVGFRGIIVYPKHIHFDIRNIEYFGIGHYTK